MNREENINLNELIKNYKNCNESKKKLVLSLRVIENTAELVKQTVNQFASSSDIDFEDLMQIGFVGLIKAIQNYNTKKKNYFSTYANYLIKGEIQHFLRDKYNLIKLPRRLSHIAEKYEQSKDSAQQDNTDILSDEKLLELISKDDKKIPEEINLLNYKKFISLDQTLNINGDDFFLIDKLPSENYQELIEKFENKMMLKDLINELPEELKNLIEMSYFKDMSQREIAKQTNLSQMQVSRKIRKALNTMYNYIKERE